MTAHAGAAAQQQGGTTADDLLVQKANAIRAVWNTLARAFAPPPAPPPRNKCHWDFLLQEAGWLAHDVMQERLWRQAVAHHLAHEAAAFDRGRLKPIKTRVCQSVEVDANGFGKVQAGKEDRRHSKANSSTTANSNHSGSTEENGWPLLVPDLPCFAAVPHLGDVLTAQLEELDVARLTRHADAVARYTAAVDEARKAQPVTLTPDEEELLLGKRKARKPKPVLLEDELGLGLGADLANSPAGARQRPRPGTGGVGLQGRPGAEMSDVETAPRDRKKRKNREFEDGDYEPPTKMAGRDRMPGAARPPLPGGMRPDAQMPGGMPVPGKAQGARAANQKTPPGKHAALSRQDSAGALRMASMGQPYQQRARAANQWTQLDEQLLMAFVAEFGQNWYLIADVLRTATSMQGISRRHEVCKQYYMHLVRSRLQVPENEDLRPEHMQTPLMTKPAAKEVLLSNLPVSDFVLNQHRTVLVDVVAKLQQRRITERQQTREMHKYRAPDHHTHQACQQKMLLTTQNAYMNPLQLGVVPLDPSLQSSTQQQQVQLPSLPPQQQQQQQPLGAGGLPGPAGEAMGARAMSAGQGLGQGLGGAGPSGGPHPGMGPQLADRVRSDAQLNDAAAAQAAAQANAAAAAAANAALAQQQQGGMGAPPPAQQAGGGGGGGGGHKLPPGMTKEQVMQICQSTPLPQLQQQVQAAATAFQQNRTQANHTAYAQAAGVFQWAKYLHARQTAAAQQQQQQGMGGAGQPGQANGVASNNPNRLISPHSIQQLLNSGRLRPESGPSLLAAAQQGNLTLGQVQQVVRQQQAQAQAAAQGGQAGAPPGQLGPGGLGGALPRQASGNLAMPPPQMPHLPQMGQGAGWPGAAGGPAPAVMPGGMPGGMGGLPQAPGMHHQFGAGAMQG